MPLLGDLGEPNPGRSARRLDTGQPDSREHEGLPQGPVAAAESGQELLGNLCLCNYFVSHNCFIGE